MTTATVFALDQVKDAVAAYFADASRSIAAEVLVGEWETEQHYGAPRVVLGIGPFRYVGAGAFPPGFRWAPNHQWSIDATHAAPVIGARMQQVMVWVHSVQPGDFASADPTATAVEARRATAALSDLTYAALRDAHGHDLVPSPGRPLAEERGEFVYGSVLAWAFEIPIPVLGDVYVFDVAQQMSGNLTTTVNDTPAVPGDTIEAP